MQDNIQSHEDAHMAFEKIIPHNYYILKLQGKTLRKFPI